LNYAGLDVKIDKMAEKDRQIDAYKPARPQGGPQRRLDILRAKDIIPGGERPVSGGENIAQVDVPRFDLAEDIMAEQRRLIAIRRKGPGGAAPIPVTTPQLSSDSPPASRCSDDRGAFEGICAGWDPIIANIVARDIEQLCAGGAWR
jgi:hypothetical protein